MYEGKHGRLEPADYWVADVYSGGSSGFPLFEFRRISTTLVAILWITSVSWIGCMASRWVTTGVGTGNLLELPVAPPTSMPGCQGVVSIAEFVGPY